MMDACRDEIDANCAGKEYTPDAVICLTEWTKGVTYSNSCQAALPKKVETKKKEQTAEVIVMRISQI